MRPPPPPPPTKGSAVPPLAEIRPLPANVPTLSQIPPPEPPPLAEPDLADAPSAVIFPANESVPATVTLIAPPPGEEDPWPPPGLPSVVGWLIDPYTIPPRRPQELLVPPYPPYPPPVPISQLKPPAPAPEMDAKLALIDPFDWIVASPLTVNASRNGAGETKELFDPIKRLLTAKLAFGGCAKAPPDIVRAPAPAGRNRVFVPGMPPVAIRSWPTRLLEG